MLLICFRPAWTLCRVLLCPLLLLAGLLAGGTSIGAAPSPYTSDAHTLFLFHFEEAAGGSVTTNAGIAGGSAYSVNETTATATPPLVTDVLGGSGFAGFGQAAAFATGELIGYDYNLNGSYDGDASGTQLSADSLAMSSLNMGNGGQTPWTIEAMIRPSSITIANQEIICTDSSAGTASRGFQFRITSTGQLELNLIALGPDIKTTIPTLALDAVNGFVANAWYHVAATYDGANLILYWTKVSSTVVACHPISTNAVAITSAFGAVQGPLGIGNRSRSPAVEYFQGLIDEVRISNIARAPTEMLTASGLPVITSLTVSPTNTTIYAGTAISLSAEVSSLSPVGYFWQTDGASGGTLTNLPAANTNSCVLDTTGMPAGIYQFGLIASNSVGLSAIATVTLNILAASGPFVLNDTALSPPTVYAGGSVDISATFGGNPPISYQWFFNNAPILGATNNVYSIAAVHLGDAGAYYLVASNNVPVLGGQTQASTAGTLTVAALPAAVARTNTVSGLLCELLAHPEQTVITAQNPRFSWVYQPFARNDSQAGYQIIVASSQALALAGTGDLWDSGLVPSSNSINVPYAGANLQASSSYFWRVRPVSRSGQMGAFSAVQRFNMASLLTDPLLTSGVIYQTPAAGSANCHPLRYVPAPPVLIVNTAPGNWFVDFGQDAFGYVTVHASGNYAGTNVLARYGEMASGYTVNASPPSGSLVRYGTTTFALQSGDVQYSVHPPSFSSQLISPPAATYGVVMPFRYLELNNFPGTLTAADVVQQRLASEFDTNAATFSSSNPALNQVWNLCRNSMEWLTFDGIYVDGDRERKPYEADAYIQQLSTYAVNNDFTLPRCTFEYLVSHPTWPTEWKFHMILVAWADYLQTGNADLLNKYYASLQQDSFMWAAAGNGLMRGFPGYAQTVNSDIVDWPAGDRDGFTGISSSGYRNWTNSVNNAFYFRCLQIMSQVATITGHTNDATMYATNAALVYDTYNATFWTGSSYVDGVGTTHASAHANFFPLAFGLVPANKQAAVVNYLHSRIAALKGMPPSVYGAQYLLDALFQVGDADTALGLITTNGPRSWINMINLGSTLTAEAWNFTDKSNEDWNHAWGAAAGNQITRHILGVQPLTPGYGQLLIQPHLGQTLSFAQGVVPTIRGPVFLCASNVSGQFQLLVNIPGNVTATVMLPATTTTAILDGAVVSGTLSTDSLAHSWLTVTNIGSGQHALWSSATSSPATTTIYNNWASSWFGTNASNPAFAAQSADPDGDGVSNYNEFVAGTDPLNPGEAFRITSVDYSPTGTVTVTVSGMAARHYALQRSFTLNPTEWVDAATQTATFDTQQIILQDSTLSGVDQAFLRVAISYP